MNWTSFEAFPVQTCALDPKPMQYVRFREGLKRTRLTYNCAHLRSTKESLTFEYLDILFLYHVSPLSTVIDEAEAACVFPWLPVENL